MTSGYDRGAMGGEHVERGRGQALRVGAGLVLVAGALLVVASLRSERADEARAAPSADEKPATEAGATPVEGGPAFERGTPMEADERVPARASGDTFRRDRGAGVVFGADDDEDQEPLDDPAPQGGDPPSDQG